MSQLPIITQSEFYEAMKAYFVANQDSVTDMNTGSGIDTQLQAMSVQLNKAMVKASGYFKLQFEDIPFKVFQFERKGKTKATGTAVFSRASALPTPVTIPIGTVISTSAGLLYKTTEVGTILAGNTSSGAIAIEANEEGSKYNVLAGIINIITSSLDGVNSVVNNAPTVGGQDEETNGSYYTRFYNFLLGLARSNRYGVITGSTGVAGIQSAYIQDHFPPEQDLYNFTAYVDDGSGNVPASKLAEVALALGGNDTSAQQGYAAAGINFRVLSAGLIPVDVTYTVLIDPNIITTSAAATAISTLITNYINSLWVGTNVIHSEIISQVNDLSGVVSVKEVTLNTQEADLVVQPAQVARTNTITGAFLT